MTQLVLFATDVVAAIVLVFGLYFPRHRRRDLVVAYLGVNIGVLAVASSLSAAKAGAGMGLGLGLFGVLSIIRLRSTQLDQLEVAYYFCALALGILGAMETRELWRPIALSGLILLVMFVADHPRLLRAYRHQLMMLDMAITDEVALIAHVEQRLGARVLSASVEKVDLVNDTTLVEVRYVQRSPKVASLEASAAASGVRR